MPRVLWVLLAIILFATPVHAQPELRSGGKGAKSAQPITSTVIDGNTNGVDVNIVGGGGTGGGPADTAPNTSASESDTTRQKTSGTIRLLDTTQGAGSQLVTGKGDQTSGMWVNCKSGCAGAAGDGTATGALGAANAAVSIALSTYLGADVNFTTGGNLVGTVLAEASNDGTTSWYGAVFANAVTGVVSTSLASPTSGNYTIVVPGSASHVRVRVSAYTSGSTTANLRTTAGDPVVLLYGTDGSNPRAVRTDASGYLTPAGGDLVLIDANPNDIQAAIAGGAFLQYNAFPMYFNGTTWDRQRGTIANGALVDVSRVQGTVTVSGTVTANAGTNLNTSALALDATVGRAQGSTTSGQTGPLVQGAVTTAAPSYTTAQTSPLSLTTAGALRGDLATIAGTAPSTAGKLDVKGADGDVFVRQAAASNLNATVVQGNAGSNAQAWWTRIGDATNGPAAVKPSSASAGSGDPSLVVALSPNSPLPAGASIIGALSANQSVNVNQVAGAAVNVGTGTSSSATQRVAVSSDSTLTSVGSITSTVTVAGAKTNNNAAPGATNVGTLPGVATNAAPSYTEGNQVALSTDLTGALRVAGGGGLSVTDSATWTAASSAFTPTGGEYNPNATPLTSGQQGTVAMTANRALQENLRNSYGQEIGVASPTGLTLYSPPLMVAMAPSFPAAPPSPLLRQPTSLTRVTTGTPIATPVQTVQVAGAVASNGAAPFVRCDQNKAINTAASGFTELVSLVGSKSIFVCGYTFVSTSALSVKFSYGTGSACGTGTVDLTGAMAVAANGGVVNPVSEIPVFEMPAGQAFCINLSGATQVSGHIKYTQF